MHFSRFSLNFDTPTKAPVMPRKLNAGVGGLPKPATNGSTKQDFRFANRGSATNIQEARLRPTQRLARLVTLFWSTRDIVGGFHSQYPFAFGHGCDHQSYVPRIWHHVQSISFVCSIRRGQRRSHRNDRADTCKNRHHLPHLPGLRTGKAVLPGIHHRCCNSHFGSQVKRGHSVLAELYLNPFGYRFHLHGQGLRLCRFPCF